jgi:signal transduction histidine kinase
MKLQAAYNRGVIIAALIALLAGGVADYFLIRYALLNQLDETLRVEEQEILDHVNTNKSLPSPSRYKDQRISFFETQQPVQRTFRSINIFDSTEQRTEVIRQLDFPVSVNGRLYRATVIKSQTETEDLITWILIATGLVLSLLLAVLFVANRFFLKNLWMPLYRTVNFLQGFKVSNPNVFVKPHTHIEEFTALNDAVASMTGKVVQDFHSLKAFADNASHEMQTPLAIIHSKMDLLIQDEQLNATGAEQLQSMYDAVNKLTRINQSLLLLAKIENDQFATREPVSIDKICEQKIVQLEDIVLSKKIDVRQSLQPLCVSINPVLAEILTANLLTNAIRHNHDGGVIDIQTTRGSLLIANTGITKPLSDSILFDRFNKSGSSDGSGLGLTIVKRICELNQINIEYRYHEEMHQLTLLFPENIRCLHDSIKSA